MSDIVHISKGFNAQLVATVKAVKAMRGVEVARNHKTKTTVNNRKAVILDEELAASTWFVPTSGLATVCQWSVDDAEYVQTVDQITVYNHSTSEAPAVDTPGAAIWIDGHWWFFADCEPLTSRPTPPWEE